MKKRVLKTIGVVMAAVMCFGMTAMAATSPQAQTYVVKNVVSATDKDGNAVNVEMSDATTTPEAKALNTEEGLKKALGDAYNANMVVADVKEIKVPEGTVFPVTITFTMEGVTASSVVQILHWNGTEWEKIPTTVGEGTVTGTFNSLSPVAFVVDKTTVSGGKVSPKTSASATATIALLGICAAVAAVGMKKRAFER